MLKPETPEELVVFFQNQYTLTQDPVNLLHAFCHLESAEDGSVVVPSWIASKLANGFDTFLEGLLSNRNISLESSLGIDEKTRIEITSLDKMVVFVYIYRRLYDLPANKAIRAVYLKYENYIKTRGKELKHQGVTRIYSGFKDYYDRQAKVGYPEWLAETENSGEYNDQNRDEELSFVDDKTASFIKRHSPYYKKH